MGTRHWQILNRVSTLRSCLIVSFALLSSLLWSSEAGAAWVRLHWTAPGDDGNEGTANYYVLKYSLVPITAGNWEQTPTWPGVPIPSPAGSLEACVVTGLLSETPYYFRIVTVDDAGNASPLSNQVVITSISIQPPVLIGWVE